MQKSPHRTYALRVLKVQDISQKNVSERNLHPLLYKPDTHHQQLPPCAALKTQRSHLQGVCPIPYPR